MWHLRSGPPRGPPESPTVTRTTCSKSAPPSRSSRTTATEPAPAATMSGEYGDCASSLLALGSAPAATSARTTPTTGLPSSSSGGSVTAQHSGGSKPPPGGPLGSAPRRSSVSTAASSPASDATPRGVNVRPSRGVSGRLAALSSRAPPSRSAAIAAQLPLPAACARGGMPPEQRSGSAPAPSSARTVSASSSLAAAASGVRCLSAPYGPSPFEAVAESFASLTGAQNALSSSAPPSPSRPRRWHTGHWHADDISGSPSSSTAASMGSSGSTRRRDTRRLFGPFPSASFAAFAAFAASRRARQAASTAGSSSGSARFSRVKAETAETPSAARSSRPSRPSRSSVSRARRRLRSASAGDASRSRSFPRRGFFALVSSSLSSLASRESSSPRQSSSARARSDWRVITARPSGVMPPTPTRGSAPSRSSMRVMVALLRSVAVSRGGIHESGARTSAPSAMSRAAAAAWSDITASTSGVTVSCPSRRSAVLHKDSMSAPTLNRNAIIAGRPARAAANKGVASSSGLRRSTSAPRSTSARATGTHPLSAAACSAVVLRATLRTRAVTETNRLGSAAWFFSAAPRSAAAVASSPARHAPTSAWGVTSALHRCTKCRAARSGPSASRSAAMAASSSPRDPS